MKPHHIFTLIVWLLAVLTLGAKAATFDDTNELFVTTDGSMVSDTNGNLSLPPEVVEAARHAPECRPSSQDTNGHWGAATEGFQMSVRFETNRFVTSQQVIATVILRNVATNAVQFIQERNSDKFFKTFLRDSSGEDRKRIDIHDPPSFPEQLTHMVVNPKQRVILPHTQVKWQVELGSRYDLSVVGKYFFQVEVLVPSMSGTTNITVKSGAAEFEIVKRE